ncbi:MAG: Translation initiation factor IF-2 [candidate division TM6 bacterium GW2011_GWF2_38_10]|nr:MAG: Translation initiation factor IF-2 [candidate division TM6 bacterium GW2011_GWF2_38_10]
MRVYEIAKELGVNSKEIVSFLKEGGFAVASHMSVLSDDALDAVRKKYTAPTQSTKSARVEPLNKHETKEPAAKPAEQRMMYKQSEKKTPKKSIEGIVYAQNQHEKNEEKTDVFNDQDLFENVAVGGGANLLDESLNLGALSKGREKIDRFLTKKIADVAGAPRSFRRRRRRRVREVREQAVPKVVTNVIVDKSMPLFEVADMFGRLPGELITALIKRGMMCNRNYVLNPDTIKSLADQFGIAVTMSTAENAVDTAAALRQHAADTQHLMPRWPIVVVMGHVDHGKTTLLDYIRKMNVAGGEKGGITQHLGAYEVASTHGKVVFLDTPGHEAFTYIREQGSRITDIAVLVVAADDGIKPQTVEAINHAKKAGVPIIVAVNKIDKVQSPAAIETVKRQLAQHELMPEDWGGQTVVVPISAKTGQGVDDLLELIVLQSQLMELKADEKAPTQAFVLESKVERGFGPVATVICTQGVLRQGDFFVCGGTAGRVRLLINTYGKKVPHITPGIPAQVVGFDSFSSIGESLIVVTQDVYAKARAGKNDESTQVTTTSEAGSVPVLLQNATQKQKSINVIIKADTRGSKEALVGCIEKLGKLSKEVKCPIYIVSSSIGDITEGDIDFAENTNSMIVGLHVKQEKNAALLAKQKNVTVLLHSIIYHLVEDLEKLLLSKKEVEITWQKVGEAVVKKVFDIKGVGVIAGCYMRDGILTREHKVVCVRNGKEIGEAKISSLQRDKKSVKEVHAGFECGFMCDNFNDWAEGDTVYAYAQVKEKHK